MKPQDRGLSQPPRAAAQESFTLHSRPPDDAPDIETEGYSPAPQSSEGCGDSRCSVSRSQHATDSLNSCQDGAKSERCLNPSKWADDGQRFERHLKVEWPRIQGWFQRKAPALDPGDLTQETVARSLEARAAISHLSEEGIPSFLWGIARNVLREGRRRARTVGAWPNEAPARPPTDFDDVAEWLAEQEAHHGLHAPPDSVEVVVGNREVLSRALQALPGADHVAIETWNTHMEMRTICQARGFRRPPPLTSRESVAFHRAVVRLRGIVQELER